MISSWTFLYNHFDVAHLLVVCDNKLSVFPPCHPVGFTIVLHANSSLATVLVYLENTTIRDVGDVEVPELIACWPFEEDILEISSKASTPITFAFAAKVIRYARQDLRFNDWGDGVEIHLCLRMTSC
jgi:hypothetical protein